MKTLHMWGTICTCGGTIQYLFHIRKGGPYLTFTIKAVLKKPYHTCGGTIRLYMLGTIRYLFHRSYGGTIRVIDSYKVPAFHTRYGVTIRVIDSYKVPTFHIKYGGP